MEKRVQPVRNSCNQSCHMLKADPSRGLAEASSTVLQ